MNIYIYNLQLKNNFNKFLLFHSFLCICNYIYKKLINIYYPICFYNKIDNYNYYRLK